MALDSTLFRVHDTLGKYRDLIISLGAINGMQEQAGKAASLIDDLRDEVHGEMLIEQLARKRVS